MEDRIIHMEYSNIELWFIKYVCCICMSYPRYQLIIDSKLLQEVENLWTELQKQKKSKSYLKILLTPEIYENIKYRQSLHYGSTLADIIQSGVKNPSTQIGVYATDVECYRTFAEFMYPVICYCHKLQKIYTHPNIPDFGPRGAFYILDEDAERIKSIRFEINRNLKKWTLTPTMTKKDFKNCENYVKKHLKSFKSSFKGSYAELHTLEPYDIKILDQYRLLIPLDDKLFEDGNGRNYWPIGRGVFLGGTLDFAIWINHEDHFKVIVAHPSGNFARTYDRMIQIHEKIHMRFEYHVSHELGYITVNPGNIGTGLKCEIEIQLPYLNKYPDLIINICEKSNLSIHGSDGEFSQPNFNSTFFIRTIQTESIDEFQCSQPIYEAVLELLVEDHKIFMKTGNKSDHFKSAVATKSRITKKARKIAQTLKQQSF